MMATIKKIKSGYEAKREGELFERMIEGQTLKQKFHSIKIPMGAKMLSAFKMIQVATPFDFILFHQKGVIALDAKSTKGLRFNASSITPHQLIQLSKVEQKGHKAGYLVNFRELDQVIFYSASKLSQLTKLTSLLPTDGLLVGDKMGIDLLKILSSSEELQHSLEESNPL